MAVMNRTYVHVKFPSGYTIDTPINLTLEGAKEYYMTNWFNTGGMSYDHETDTEIEVDRMEQAIEVIEL